MNRLTHRLLFRNAFLTLGLLAMAAPVRALLLGPTPYLCFDTTAIAGCGGDDSPFAGVDFSGGYFHLEDFEDGAVNTPGAHALSGFLSGPGGLADSVDEDDGTIDGSGTNGRALFAAGATGIRFTFDAGVLGVLPTHVGIVWTDGAFQNQVTFQAFDANDVLVGEIVAPPAPIGPANRIGDDSFAGGTAEDRFFGIQGAGGIASILIRNSIMAGGGDGIEVDHLQYGNPGLQPPPTVPEPGTVTLAVLGLGVLARKRMRAGRPT